MTTYSNIEESIEELRVQSEELLRTAYNGIGTDKLPSIRTQAWELTTKIDALIEQLDVYDTELLKLTSARADCVFSVSITLMSSENARELIERVVAAKMQLASTDEYLLN